jgi:hypothetical protein
MVIENQDQYPNLPPSPQSEQEYNEQPVQELVQVEYIEKEPEQPVQELVQVEYIEKELEQLDDDEDKDKDKDTRPCNVKVACTRFYRIGNSYIIPVVNNIIGALVLLRTIIFHR